VVGIDTLRWDALGLNGRERATSPELDAWAGDAVAFDDARAPAPRTRPSFRTALTGRYPGAARATRQTAAVLRAHGFRTAGFAANVHLVPRFGFNEGFEHWHYENGAKAGDQVDRALAWIAAHEREDWYVFVHLMDPHTWYNAPLPFGVRFTGGRHPKSLPDPFDRWQVDAAMRRKTLTDADKELVRGAYDGEVAYTSHALERLLRQRDAGRRLTVIHSDHGEEFWDHGGFEHNHSLYDELVKALLVVRPPDGWGGGPHRVAAPVGLQDIAPTLLDLLEIPVADRPPTDGVSLRPYLDSTRPDDGLATVLAERALYQGHLMFDTERWSTTHRGHKYILHTGSGREELYDLRADPREQAPLPSDHGLLPELRSALSRATGWPVGPGWRLTVRVSGPGAWGIRFDAPIAAAGIIDPEALREVRANLEWGERPTITVAEVGRVSLSADHTQLLFEPGPKADDQVLYIRCEAACPAGVFQGVGMEVALAPGDHEVAGTKLRATPGTVIEPAGDDADALATPTDSLQLEALKLLGYLDGDHGGAPPH
jgi:arylsulfatase A-like enzyme